MHRDPEVIGLSDSTVNNKPEDDFEFDCPECGTHILGEVDRCPKCGVEFVIEEVAEIECPQCHATISGESVSCPKCGHSFQQPPAPVEEAEPVEKVPDPKELEERAAAAQQKELREEFSELVNEVGPMLAMAKDFSIDTTATRRLIDKAVGLGKRREIDPAVKTMRECRELIIRSLVDRLERDIMYLENLAVVARKMSSDHQSIEKVIADTKERYAVRDYEGALNQARSGKRLAEQLTGKYVEAHDLYEALEKLILNSERFYLDVRESRKLLNEARDAGETGDWTTMGILSRKGREELNKVLPEMLTVELRKAKQSLLDAKSNGKDVTAMVKILKDAGVSMKREKFEEALERLTEFRAEERNL
jgi:DNA-directed RNA polymerase subunit RPC12/RpoP